MNLPSSSIRKAAILVASLDTELADHLLDQMPAEQADVVRRYVLQLGEIDPGEEAIVIQEFFRRPAAMKRAVRPGPAAAAAYAATSASAPKSVRVDAAHGVPAPTATTSERFHFLREAQAAKLMPILASEHPQTIAVVLSHLPPEQASELLATLPGDVQLEVVRRLIVIDEADPDVLREVEHGLKSRVAEVIRDERRRAAGTAAVANILDAAEPRVRRMLLANIARHDRSLAGAVGRRPVEFEELDGFDDAALATVLAAADSEIVRLALAGALPTTVARFLALVTPAEARTMRKAIDALGPTRLSDVEEAQRTLAAIAEQLAAEGRIELPLRWMNQMTA
jgi:flagellar motor switch protein FliG